MKTLTKIALIITVIFFSTGCNHQSMAFDGFKNIEVYDIENGAAKIKWSTPNWQTKGIIYFGESPSKLERYTGYSLYNYYHETSLSGLQKKKTYYFKIVAIDRLENSKESFLQSFSTKNMKKDDIIKPQFKEQKILQVINNAVAISWATNEETKAVIYYGDEEDNLNKTVKVKSFQKGHELLIYKLKSGTKYYLKIVAIDKSGNKTNGKRFIFNTNDYKGSGPNLLISDIKPLSHDEELIFSRKVIINFKTNLIAKSVIQYGVASEKYKYKKTVSKSRELKHQITLTRLEPDTTYYYKITASDSFNKKKKIISGMTFTTGSLKKRISSGSLVRGSGYKVYFISGNNKLWIKSASVFNKLGYKWDWIQTIDNVYLNEYKEGKSIESSKIHPDGTLIKYSHSRTVYLIENKKKRPFSSAESFVEKGYSWNRIMTVSKNEKYKTGKYL
ncbi:fibronectin type III domain-containing protein [Candidatus Parcubacteria bacterium]|nr:fibronectin type III domain-containing protein [Candidatus Parcubacteria bacterium]